MRPVKASASWHELESVMKLKFVFAVVAMAALGPVAVMAQPAPTFFGSTDANDGAHPCAGLVLSGDTLYGTTAGGADGFWGCGTVFKVNIDGTGFTVLHSIKPPRMHQAPSGGEAGEGGEGTGTPTTERAGPRVHLPGSQATFRVGEE
jgi:uncharacterized repeat protein (TIGR03803 family)